MDINKDKLKLKKFKFAYVFFWFWLEPLFIATSASSNVSKVVKSGQK